MKLNKDKALNIKFVIRKIGKKKLTEIAKKVLKQDFRGPTLDEYLECSAQRKIHLK